tara:strand:+ start:335 stop:580 length:246 start_codon:yes stop_codon:yes gene_type:complete
MFIEERNYIEQIKSAIDKLQTMKYNDSKIVESHVVSATDDLIKLREEMQSKINQFDSWAETQSEQEPMMVTGLDEKKEEDK